MTLLLLLFNLSLTFFFFALPGLALYCLRKTWPFLFCLVTTGAVLGYLSFWVFFHDKLAGRSLSFLVTAISLAIVIRYRRQALALVAAHRTPLLLVLLAALLHLNLLYLHAPQNQWHADLPNTRFTAAALPGDNVIPYLLANRIYAHEPVRPFCCGDWLSSDRPPLQAAIVLWLRPLRAFGTLDGQYQVIATLLQELWIAGAWAFLVSLGWPPQFICRVLLICGASQFAFFNSVYVWPKLFAAGLVFFAAASLLRRSPSCAALAFSLAILAHPGSVFTAPGLALCFYRRVPWTRFLPAAAIFAGLWAPWLLYQHFVDPPGNRLTKMHLAGVYAVDARTLPEALRDEYGSRTAGQIAWNKLTNLATAVMPSVPYTRDAAMRYLPNALGLLNLGWLALLIRRPAGPLLRPIAVNLLLWCLLLFGPHGTLLAHASFADLLLLAFVLSAALVDALRKWSALFLAAELAVLAAQWTSPGMPIDAGAAIAATAAGALFLLWYRSPEWLSGGVPADQRS